MKYTEDTLMNTKKSSNIAAGIDIGSNSIRLLIAEVENKKITNIIYQEKATTRLATNINTTSMLAPVPFNNSIAVLKRFKQALDKYHVSNIVTVATSAVREAKNGIDFINAAKNIGIEISIISGDEEGLLEYNGVCAGFEISSHPLIVDVGGGSSEIIYKTDSHTIHTESHKIGVVKMADMFNFRDNNSNSLEKCNSYIQNFFKNVIINVDINSFIATAGTATTLAAIDMEMKKYDYTRVNGYKLHRNKIESILHFIYNTKYEERILITGMDQGREDLIIPGILIILNILDKTKLDTVTVSDFGLREGAVVRAAGY